MEEEKEIVQNVENHQDEKPVVQEDNNIVETVLDESNNKEEEIKEENTQNQLLETQNPPQKTKIALDILK